MRIIAVCLLDYIYFGCILQFCLLQLKAFPFSTKQLIRQINVDDRRSTALKIYLYSASIHTSFFIQLLFLFSLFRSFGVLFYIYFFNTNYSVLHFTMSQQRLNTIPFIVLLGFASLLTSIPSTLAIPWNTLSCPSPDSPFPSSCTQKNTNTNKSIAVSIMIQDEASIPSYFNCTDTVDPALVYCARVWPTADSGGVGSCFFVLPPQRSYQCISSNTGNTGDYNINVIDAAYSVLVDEVVDATQLTTLSCPSSLATVNDCTYTNTLGTDMFVHTNYQTIVTNSSSSIVGFTCSLVGSTNSPLPVRKNFTNPSLCAFSAPLSGTASTGASCIFTVPTGGTYQCTSYNRTSSSVSNDLSTAGSTFLSFGSTIGLPLQRTYINTTDSNVPSVSTCPPASYPSTNMCDCSTLPAPSSSDQLIAIHALAVDNNFSSFHCFIDGTNVCAFGVDTNNYGLGGTCAFILPANEQLTCTMEWGALSFNATSLLSTTRSIFTSSSSSSTANTRKAGFSIYPSKRSFFRTVPSPSSSFRTEYDRLRTLFQQWKQKYSVTYSSDQEENFRFRNFMIHVAIAEQVVKKGQIQHKPFTDTDGHVSDFNRFADWSRNEFEQYYHLAHYRSSAVVPSLRSSSSLASVASSSLSPLPSDYLSVSATALPSSVNWTASGKVTPVKNQEQCGSCWSFSTTGCIESAWAIANNELISLSEQYLVSCETNCQGCNGGWPYLAIDYISIYGAYTEASYPYVSGNGNVPVCNTSDATLAVTNVTGFYTVGSSTNTSAQREDEMQKYIAMYGPISVSLDAMTQIWWSYTGGIVTGCCDTDVDHAVLLTGYGVENTLEYWIIKNSWGDWGENGYIRLQKGTNQCDITYDPVIPVVAGGILPPPPPSPRPYPAWSCPFDAVQINTTTTSSCVWKNNTFGMIMPSPTVISSYCDYISQGYMGYVWATNDQTDTYPCAPSFNAGGNGGSDYFCTITNNSNYVVFPPNVVAICDQLTEGIVGYSWSI